MAVLPPAGWKAIYRFRDGKAVSFQQYTDTAQWARLMPAPS